MNDSPKAAVVALAIIAPIMVLCCAAPLLVVSVIAAVTAWLGGVDPAAAAFVGLLSAVIVISLLRWRKRRSTAPEL